MTASIAFWGYAVAALGFLIFSLHMAAAWRGNVRGILLFAALALSGVWCASSAAYIHFEGRLLWISTVILSALRLCAWLTFLLALLIYTVAPKGGLLGQRSRWPLLVVSLIGINACANIVLQSFPEASAALLGKQSQLIYLPNLLFTIAGLMLVEQVWRNWPVASRWSIKPLVLALLGTFGFDLFYFCNAFLFRQVDPDVWAVRGLVNVLVLPLIAVSSARNTDWSFRISVSRQLVFHTTALLGSGLYLLAVAGAGFYLRYFGGSWGAALQTVFIFAGLLALALILVSGTLRSKLRVMLNKHFFSYRYDYRQEWLRFTQSLSSVSSQTADLSASVIKSLADLVESPGGSLWLADPDGKMRLSGRLNFPDNSALEPADSAMLTFLSRTRWVLNLEDVRENPGRYEGLKLSPWLEELDNAWLLVPLFSTERLIGFVLIAPARVYIDLNWEVWDLLRTAANQAASYIANMRAAEALLETKKFDAFNRMSAFVVHDVKNLVAQLSLLLKNAEKHKDNPEFQQDMFMTIDHVVERMKQLLLQLRAGTTPIEQARPTQLAPVIARVIRAKSGLDPAVESFIEEPLVVRGHEERLERVLGHLVQNAIEATPPTGRVWIRLYAAADMAVVEVGDTGKGMSASFINEQLFKPFVSTKHAGMGIGAYESKQYVGELGGQIVVESQEGRGTVFKVQLPIHSTQVQSPVASVESA